MKRIFFLVGLLGLGACDRPQYDLQMVCEDGAKGNLLVGAKIYKSRADLVVKRLDKELRGKALGHGNMWLADHVWLYNQIPQIDDEIELSLPVNKHGDYELDGKVKLELGRDNLTGGQGFILWHMSDNNLTMRDGYKIPDGQPMVGVTCNPVIDPVARKTNITTDIKNCLAYVSSQLEGGDCDVDAESRFCFYDENTGRKMYVGDQAVKEILDGIEPHHFYFVNQTRYPEDASHACEVAARMRAYIDAHIDAEYISNKERVELSVASGEMLSVTCDGEEVFIRGE